jgi:hypothetical protein
MADKIIGIESAGGWRVELNEADRQAEAEGKAIGRAFHVHRPQRRHAKRLTQSWSASDRTKQKTDRNCDDSFLTDAERVRRRMEKLVRVPASATDGDVRRMAAAADDAAKRAEAAAIAASLLEDLVL